VLDFQRFGLLGKSLGKSLGKLAILLKTYDNKTNPRINSLIFNDLQTPFKPLIFNALQTSLKRLIFNAFSHFLVLGGWVKGRVLSKG